MKYHFMQNSHFMRCFLFLTVIAASTLTAHADGIGAHVAIGFDLGGRFKLRAGRLDHHASVGGDVFLFGDGFDDYFVARWNGDPASLTLQESEVKAARFATHEEIAEMTRAGTFIPYHPALMDLLFFHDRHHSIYDWK